MLSALLSWADGFPTWLAWSPPPLVAPGPPVYHLVRRGTPRNGGGRTDNICSVEMALAWASLYKPDSNIPQSSAVGCLSLVSHIITCPGHTLKRPAGSDYGAHVGEHMWCLVAKGVNQYRRHNSETLCPHMDIEEGTQ